MAVTWICGESRGHVEHVSGRKDHRGGCRLELASAPTPNPAPCQQLSVKGNADHASLHGSNKAF